MKSILFFDSMLTPKIITAVYWLILFGSAISGLSAMFGEYGEGFFAGVGIILAGAIGGRIWCELLIVLFKIHDNLHQIAHQKTASSTEDV